MHPQSPSRLTNGVATFPLSALSLPHLSPSAITLSLSTLYLFLTSHRHGFRHHSPASESRRCCAASRLSVMTN
ncbi:uncharacterized protein DS421_18g615150 [Arachis hypogaea]|nr:uncharacterized protein DS421_18g615150 [Arachis hypogaea]